MKFVALLLFIAMLIIPVSASNPVIDTWYNDKTNDNTQDLAIYINETIKFNVTANQSIDTWNWSIDNIDVQDNNYDNFSTSWDSDGVKTLNVNATNNINGTSDIINWTITVKKKETISSPEITSWYNNKTNNTALDIIINTNETIKFNVTANQSIDTWNWSIDNIDVQDNNYDNFSTSWDTPGIRNVSVNATNSNGSDTITWNITVLEEETKDVNETFLSWSPQVVDYIYVNDTMNETITYSITTNESMTEYNWTVDGVAVTGAHSDNTYSYNHTWDNQSTGFHTVVFTGNNDVGRFEFRWYVNVYEEGSYSGGSIFDIIDESLENHATDIKIRMFKRNMNKHNLGVDYFAQKVNLLHDEIAKRQMTREALRKELKAGEITQEQYVAALKQAQSDAKINSKSVKGNSKSTNDNSKPEKDNSKSTNDNSKSEKDRGKRNG